ncbi:MAG: DUF2927 domain-containing protein [Paracoccaceae bacterium]|nr:DUF2927 domain-containing protein [Paracoccaceae bacterium]
MTRSRRLWVGLAVASLALASCDMPPGGTGGQAALPPPPRSDPPAASAQSEALRVYYANLQSQLLSRGLMRSDGGERDAPFNARMLTANFIRIALFDEFENTRNGFVARPTESRLRRWAVPVRVAVRFGASVPADRRATDKARIASYLARLSRLTGHPISVSETGANFQLYIVNEDERQALGPTIRSAMPGIMGQEIAAFTQMPASTYCQVSALIDEKTSLYKRAFAVVRAEHPDLLHLSCLHEEIAQGLGLPNDSPQARPSIFNDNQEFALLTPMDELMLRMLYDPRLTPGMTAAQAEPIIARLASELLGGES